ncbi:MULTISPECIES: OFA family MFS transporter [unclassified Streptomyces]|uniref:OFA family MFS transporter n=1 Tax=unclassified Streptomyces TaxID=2593676 RepID=UPI002DD938BC|nr:MULTISPECIES: OFA family MFS transporter [unclassified Streptomyces]WSC34355.1 OFA family MFS transporter [Streptomyces sp. NBC_01763]WSC58371.1 OFA family MFS transporter [Streptomyces sp. NBC_01761]WSF89476.1 OFA family MFS transporter [Streptomyces sp. NBC_01744]WSJ55679.1 OFA family MFS transporter [Streptomyces sp. NBC_01318]
MTTTDISSHIPYREVTDRNGRVYRLGETDRDIMRRPRWTMVLLPWIGMMGISSSEYAFTSAEETLHDAHMWASGHIFWLMGVWIFFQAAVAFPAGQLRESGRLPARSAMMLGALGTLLGYLSLAYAPHVIVAYFGFGMFSGIGAGLVYATCVNMVGKWYPERKGGKTGMVNGGFAYGSVPFVFLFTSYMDLSNYQGVLVSVGVICCAAVAVAGWFFKDPPKNWWPQHVDPLKVSDDPRIVRSLAKNPPAVKQYTPREAARTPVLWMMWFCLLCTAGINIFGIAMQVPFGKEMGFAGGIVATAMSLKAIVNGTGRGVIGWISDRYGRRNTLIIVCLVLGSAQFGVFFSGDIGSMPFFLFCSMVSGFGGGAIFPLFAAMTADYFGENNNASNYGMVYSSKLISGLVGSGVGALVVGAWGYGGAFALAGSIGLASAVLAVFLRAPGRPKQGGVPTTTGPGAREAL